MTKDDVAAATSPPPAEQTGGGQISDQADQGTQQRRAYDAQSRPAQTQYFKGGTSRGRGSPKTQPARKAAGSKKPKQERKAERAAAGQRSPQQHALEDRTDARAEPGPSPPQVGRVSDDPSADQVDKSDLRAAAQVTPPTHPPSYIPYSTPHQAAVKNSPGLSDQPVAAPHSVQDPRDNASAPHSVQDLGASPEHSVQGVGTLPVPYGSVQSDPTPHSVQVADPFGRASALSQSSGQAQGLAPAPYPPGQSIGQV